MHERVCCGASVTAERADYLHLVENVVCLIIGRLWHGKQHLSNGGLHEQLLKHRVHVASSPSILETHKGVQRSPMHQNKTNGSMLFQGRLKDKFELQQLWKKLRVCHVITLLCLLS